MHLVRFASIVDASEPVVATRVIGGLGNQLFAYAAGLGIAHRRGARLILDCTRRTHDDRPLQLNQYSISAPMIFDGELKIRGQYFSLPGTLGTTMTDFFHHRLFARTTRLDGRRLKVVEERMPFSYDRRFGRIGGSIYIKGFWQSFRYFENVADTLRAELVPKAPPSEANASWLRRIRDGNSVCVHVRRGDYVTSGFRVCAPGYYVEAIKLASGCIENPCFFVFSDDLPWCRSNLELDGLTFVETNGPSEPVEELRLMAACRHHIIANSSFSWWAAWLASNSKQIVIAPQPWLADSAEPLDDLLPSQWIKVARS